MTKISMSARDGLIALLLLLTTACGGAAQDPAPAAAESASALERHFPSDRDVLEILGDRVDNGRNMGIVVGMLEANGSRRYVAYGDPGAGALPLGSKSVFQIASVTKVFTGTVLADMVLRDELELEDPVAGLLPPGVTVPSRDAVEITLAHLATHRSGLPRQVLDCDPADQENPYAGWDTKQLYDFLSCFTLPREIGAEFEYSNIGVGLLGHALALRAGQDYEALVRERILTPLDMQMTGIEDTPEMNRHKVFGHDAGGEIVPSAGGGSELAGAGALRSNVEDVLTFLEANIGEPSSPLEEAMRFAHEPRQPALGGHVGLNWIIDSVGDGRILWHNGFGEGFLAFAGFDPDAGVGVVVFTNSWGAHPEDIGKHLLNPELALAEPPAPRQPPDSPESRRD